VKNTSKVSNTTIPKINLNLVQGDAIPGGKNLSWNKAGDSRDKLPLP
jgi:hypothetical protein